MGDPRKTRKKYSTPAHPWEKARLELESAVKDKYALGNKKEIWKMNSKLKSFKGQAKKLSSLDTKQAEKERKQLTAKMISLGLLKPEDTLENVLTLTLEDVMERRLQTFVMKKGLARSMKQARQFITHSHITVDGKLMTAPSYLVKKDEEDKIAFGARSSLSDPENPERKIAKAVEEKEPEEKEKKKKKAKKKKSE